jgi:uncharacterized protein (DUF488 family)
MRASHPRLPELVLTVGHSNRLLGEFLELLQANDVKLVADVRKMPGSRSNPQFDSKALSQALKEVGIDYVHFLGLGGLRRPRADSLNTGWENRSFRAYADYLLTPEFERSLEEFLAQAVGRCAALMCAEAVPWRCHRRLIADVLVSRGVRVEHIFNRNSRQVHTLTPWARVVGGQVMYTAGVK